MIHEVEGDILFSKADVVAHGIAANDPMSQGLAKSLHEQYPDMHREFHRWCHSRHPKPGEAWAWKTPSGATIVNLITQEGGYGRGAHPGKAKPKYVNHALRSLKKMLAKQKATSVALPMLATGVGGLTWSDVRPLINNQLADLEIPVYVYANYLPGITAKEP